MAKQGGHGGEGRSHGVHGHGRDLDSERASTERARDHHGRVSAVEFQVGIASRSRLFFNYFSSIQSYMQLKFDKNSIKIQKRQLIAIA